MKNFVVLLALSTSLCAATDILIERGVYLPADGSESPEEYIAPCCEARCEGCRRHNPHEHDSRRI